MNLGMHIRKIARMLQNIIGGTVLASSHQDKLKYLTLAETRQNCAAHSILRALLDSLAQRSVKKRVRLGSLRMRLCSGMRYSN